MYFYFCETLDSVTKKDDQILMTESPYYTPVGDINMLWNTDETPVSGCVLEVNLSVYLQFLCHNAYFLLKLVILPVHHILLM